MAVIRPYRPADLEALYRICLLTGDAGADASALYEDGRLIGEIYAAPYAVLSPGTALVAEDAEGVAGYIVGPTDTRAFETAMERDWWPALRARHRDPGGSYFDLAPDDRLRWLFHRPARAPGALAGPYPAHLHINLLPRLQGQGLGARLMDAWLQGMRVRGARGAHLGVSAANVRALGFYRAYGLAEIALPRPGPPGVIWFGANLG
jgi:ribosomal protein S18 acetylase RimI-like enzyme